MRPLPSSYKLFSPGAPPQAQELFEGKSGVQGLFWAAGGPKSPFLKKKDFDPQYFGVSNNFLTIGIRFSENIDCYTVAFLAKFCIRIRFFQAFTLQGRLSLPDSMHFRKESA